MAASPLRQIYGDSLGATVKASKKVGVDEAEIMVAVVRITDAAAGSDIGTVELFPLLPDNTRTLHPIAEDVALSETTAAFSSPVAEVRYVYDVRGFEQVELEFENAAGGARDVEVYVSIYRPV